MKKIYLLIAGGLMLSTLNVDAQSQRKVLIEKGSNASCAPCAAQNPGFHTMLNTVDDKYIGLNYQWYFPGYDPMYEHNPTEANGRFATYYGQNGVPTAMIDGTVPTNAYPGFNGGYAGSPAGFSATMINNRYDVASPFDIEIDYVVTPFDVTANVTVTCTQAITNLSQLKLRIAAVERVISFSSAPGSNGETTFYNIMKKFLGGMAGLTLNSNWTVGQSQTFTETWQHQNIYNFAQLSIVAFVQNDANKEVLQAGRADGATLETPFTNSGSIINVTATTSSCPGQKTITPVVRVRNTGSTNLVSCEIFASINGVDVTSNWNGNLAFMAEANVTLTPITFTATAGVNTLNIVCQNTNGTDNEDMVLSVSNVDLSFIDDTGVSIPSNSNFTPANFPYENWQVVNPDNGLTWVRQNAGGAQGQAAFINTFSYSSIGALDDFMPAPFDLTGTTTPSLSFKYANRRYSAQYWDKLRVSVATSCDGPWTQVWYKENTELATAPDGTGNYTSPAAADWRTECINLSAYAGSESFFVKFTNVNNYGNNIFIDDISVIGDACSAVGIDEMTNASDLNIYPNPVVNEAIVQMILAESAPVTIEVYDLLGKVVYSENLGTQPAGEFVNRMNFNNMTNGMYLMNITVGGQKVTRKVTVSK